MYTLTHWLGQEKSNRDAIAKNNGKGFFKDKAAAARLEEKYGHN